jgi:tetratricopeptide (TPR) repeat protein
MKTATEGESVKHSLAVLLVAAMAAAMTISWAQQAPQQPQQPAPQPTPSPSPAPSPAPAQPSTPAPGSRTPTQPQQQQPAWDNQRGQTPSPEMPRPIFLSGKVILDDGTPPPDSVVIERVCNGIARPEAYTDSKGRFSFQLGQNSNMIADASVSSASDGGQFGGGSPRTAGGMSRGISERQMMGCELRANLAGFRSEIVNLAGRRVMDNPDVGTIILRRMGNVEGLTISATTALAPKDARKAFDKAKDNFKRQKWTEAQKDLEKAVQGYPKFASAWYQLGLVHEKQNNIEAARKAYAEALSADSKFINPYRQLAQIAFREQKWQEVADTTGRIVKLNPFDFPDAYFTNAVANFNLRKLDAAETSAREALKIDSQHRIAKTSHLLGIILAQKKDYTGAAEQMENYLKFAPTAGDAELVRKQLEEMRRVSGGATRPQQD